MKQQGVEASNMLDEVTVRFRGSEAARHEAIWRRKKSMRRELQLQRPQKQGHSRSIHKIQPS